MFSAKNNNEKSKKESSKKAFLKYRDPTGEFSSQELAVGTWYIRNKLLLGKIFRIFLFSFSILIGGYGMIMWGYYAFFGYWQDRDMHRYQTVQTVNYENIHAVAAARPLVAREVETIISGQGVYDFISTVVNPNQKYVAEVTYVFSHEAGQSDVLKTIVLPGSERPVVALGNELSAFPRGLQFQIVATKWMLVDPHEISDPITYKNLRQDFSYDNLTFERATQAEEGLPVNRVTFDLYNDSAYGFFEADFLIELYNGSSRVGIVPLRINEFESGAIYNADIRTFIDTSNVSAIKLISIDNVFDAMEFMAPPRS